MTDQTPWCCTGRVSECPLCPQYGTSLLDPCPEHPVNDNTQTAVDTARLHAERRHPDYEYATTTGPRKQWDDADQPPYGDDGEPDTTWHPNLDAGYPGAGWERFDHTEEAYWRRPKTAVAVAVTEATQPAKSRLRDQIAAAIYEKSNPGYRWIDAHPDDVLAYGSDADAALKAIDGHLDIGEAEAWCKTCRRVWDGPRHRCESDAEAAIARIRDLHSRDSQGRCSYCTWLDDQAGSGLDVSHPCDTVRALGQHETATEATDTATTARALAGMHTSAEQTVNRVIDLYERWLREGPPKLGTSISREWDRRLAELHAAIQPPAISPDTVEGPGAVPAAIKQIVDRAAGKNHSATGAVMTCLSEVLTAHRQIIQAEAGTPANDTQEQS